MSTLTVLTQVNDQPAKVIGTVTAECWATRQQIETALADLLEELAAHLREGKKE
jgi:hypothetical protein